MLVIQARDRSCVHLSPVSLFPELTAAKAGGEKTKQQQSRRKIPVSPKKREGMAQGLPAQPGQQESNG